MNLNSEHLIAAIFGILGFGYGYAFFVISRGVIFP